MTGTRSRGRSGDSGEGPVRVHEPVMLRESLEVMALTPGMVVVDGTVGAGGHSSAFAEAIRPAGRLIAIDRDAEILANAEDALCQVRASASDFDYRLHHASYTEIDEVLALDGIERCDRVFIDLGVSSLQLDSPQRGFSLTQDGPLVRRARVRDQDVGSEVPLQTVRALRSRDALDADVKAKLVRGVSTRNYEGALTTLYSLRASQS